MLIPILPEYDEATACPECKGKHIPEQGVFDFEHADDCSIALDDADLLPTDRWNASLYSEHQITRDALDHECVLLDALGISERRVLVVTLRPDGTTSRIPIA